MAKLKLTITLEPPPPEPEPFSCRLCHVTKYGWKRAHKSFDVCWECESPSRYRAFHFEDAYSFMDSMLLSFAHSMARKLGGKLENGT